MPLFETIVLPLDGSEPSESALPFAAALGELTGSPVVVLHVLEEMRPIFDARRGEVVWISPQEPRVELEEPELFEEPIGRLRAAGLKVRPVFRLGDPVAEILDEAERWPAPLVVVASHGRGGIERLVLGSVADRVAREAPGPVLVVPAVPKPEQPRRVEFRTILVPLDGSPLAEQALPVALELARLARASLVLVRSAESSPARDSGRPQREAEDYLRQVGEVLARTATAPILRHVLSGDPAEQLSRFIASQRPDLVVMATHGRSGLARWILGSVTERLLTGRVAPLLLLRARDSQSHWLAREA